MANMVIDDGVFKLNQEISGAGKVTQTLSTQNKFVDKNIEINTVTPAGTLTAGSATIAGTSNKNILTEVVSAPASGAYITVTGKGAASVTVGGWIDQDTAVETANATKIYSIADATFGVTGRNVYATGSGYVEADSETPIAQIGLGVKTVDGGELSAGSGVAGLQSNGYYDGTSYDTADAITLSTAAASGYYKLTASGKGTVNRAAITSQVTTAGYFNADGSPVTEDAATSLESNTGIAEYFVKKSTLSANTVTPSTTTQTVTVGEGYAPADRTITINPMTVVTPTTSLSSSGISTFFTTGTSSDNDVELTPKLTNAAGYVAANDAQNYGGVEYYKIKTTSVAEGTTTVSGSTATRGTATWNTGWIAGDSIPAATFANTESSGVSYVDISSTTEAPVLVSGSYLYINKGYTDNLKISLAKLVPDGASAALSESHILSGYSAYNNDGQLVAGSIQTYDGSYTVA